MSKIELNTSIADYGFSQINANFQLIEDELNQKVLYRDNPVGEPNTIENQIDANDNNIINVNDLRVDNEIYLKGETISQAIDTAAGGLVGDAEQAAINAAASASQSAASATASAASAAASEASFDSFDDRYLGAKNSPPTTDNDGNPLLIGALYWDTTLSPGGTFPASDITFSPAGNIGSTTVQAAIQELDTEKAAIASPVFTGDPTAPTPATADNDTSIATTAYVVNKLASPTDIGGTTPAAGTFTTLKSSNAYVQADTISALAISSGTTVDVPNWTERTDTGSNFNPTTGVFTAPRAGRYLVTCGLFGSFESYTNAGSTLQIFINKNGTNQTLVNWLAPNAGVNYNSSLYISHVINCAASDTLKIQVRNNDAATHNLASGTTNNFLTITELP